MTKIQIERKRHEQIKKKNLENIFLINNEIDVKTGLMKRLMYIILDVVGQWQYKFKNICSITYVFIK